MANQRKCTEERREQICTALMNGHGRKTASQAAGISRETFRRWYNAGAAAARKEEMDGIEALLADERELAMFHDGVDNAEMECEVRCVKLIADSAVKDWRAAAMWLRCRRPAEWSTSRRLQVA